MEFIKAVMIDHDACQQFIVLGIEFSSCPHAGACLMLQANSCLLTLYNFVPFFRMLLAIFIYEEVWLQINSPPTTKTTLKLRLIVTVTTIFDWNFNFKLDKMPMDLFHELFECSP